MHGHKWLQTLPDTASVLPFCVVQGYIPGSFKTPVNRMNEVAKKIHFVNAWQLCGRILIIFMFYWMSCVYWLNLQYSYLIGTMGIQRCIPKWWQRWGVVWAQHCNWGDLNQPPFLFQYIWPATTWPTSQADSMIVHVYCLQFGCYFLAHRFLLVHIKLILNKAPIEVRTHWNLSNHSLVI